MFVSRGACAEGGREGRTDGGLTRTPLTVPTPFLPIINISAEDFPWGVMNCGGTRDWLGWLAGLTGWLRGWLAVWLAPWLPACMLVTMTTKPEHVTIVYRRRHSHTTCSTFYLYLSWSLFLSFFLHAVSYLLSWWFFHICLLFLYIFLLVCYRRSHSCFIFFPLAVLIIFFLYIFLYSCVVLGVVLAHLYDHPGVPFFIPNGTGVLDVT